MNKYNLLFTIDDRFVEPLMTTLYSIYCNMDYDKIDIFVMQKEPLMANEDLAVFCESLNMTYIPIITEDGRFDDAPILKHWNTTIYYRLLAHDFLPKDIEKVLYLDADVLCINPFTELYKIDMADNLYAAAGHSKIFENMTEWINRRRLRNEDIEKYINTGIMLMNIKEIRQAVKWEDIKAFINCKRNKLLFPDQDILNGLYGARTQIIPDQFYNYDVRLQQVYEITNESDWDVDSVLNQTVFLHYCGKDKPWKSNSILGYDILYKHYWSRAHQHLKQIKMK